MKKSLVILSFLLQASISSAQPNQVCNDLTEDQQEALLTEHLDGLSPTNDEVHIRQGYVFAYDYDNNVPRWVAWHATAEYRRTPRRAGRWYSFRQDRSMPDGANVTADDYTNSGFVRGHIAPYYISGGDRDDDGDFAAVGNTTEILDNYDACTVYHFNQMSNIAPQLQDLNGSGGNWYALESENRNKIDADDSEFYFLAGTIFGDGRTEDIETGRRFVGVPDAFYKVVWENYDEPVGYLFIQFGDKFDGDGCFIEEDLDDCIVDTSRIAEIAGISFE